MSAGSSSAAVVANQLLRQLDSEVFQVRQCWVESELFVQHVAVCHRHIEEEVENVLVTVPGRNRRLGLGLARF